MRRSHWWEPIFQVLIRWAVGTVGVWAGSQVIHDQLPQVPALPFLAALGVCTAVRAAVYVASDLIKNQD